MHREEHEPAGTTYTQMGYYISGVLLGTGQLPAIAGHVVMQPAAASSH